MKTNEPKIRITSVASQCVRCPRNFDTVVNGWREAWQFLNDGNDAHCTEYLTLADAVSTYGEDYVPNELADLLSSGSVFEVSGGAGTEYWRTDEEAARDMADGYHSDYTTRVNLAE